MITEQQTEETPTLSEKDVLTQRVQGYKIVISSTTAHLVQICLERMLKDGMVGLDEVDAIAMIRGEIKKGIDEFTVLQENTTRRLQEIQKEEEQQILSQEYKSQEQKKELLDNERRARKSLESQVAKLKEQLESISQPINKTSAPKVTYSNFGEGGYVVGAETNAVNVVNTLTDTPTVVEEVVIPTPEELSKVTKQQIIAIADKLGLPLDVSALKSEMIKEFTKLSEAKVKELLAS